MTIHWVNSNTSYADDLLNLDTLLIQIKDDITPIWYQFGEALKIDKEVLDKYSKYSPENSMIEMLDQWLRMYPGKRTWREVAAALKEVNFDELADSIDEVYETGTYTVYVT